MIPIPDDFELQPANTVPIKKPEAREQARLVACLRGKWKDMTFPPLVFSIPMGGSRNPVEACSLRTQGAVAGAPDLCILLPDARVIWLEMKSDSGTLSSTQIALHRQFAALRHDVLVAYSAEDALAKLREKVV